jgi:hypothetical protein
VETTRAGTILSPTLHHKDTAVGTTTKKSTIWTHLTKDVKHLFGLQFLRLVTKKLLALQQGSGSSFPVVVLMRASFIITLDGFCDWNAANNFESLFK